MKLAKSMIQVGDIVIFITYNKPAKVLKVDGDHAWIKLVKKEPLIGELFALINQLRKKKEND